jgi:hypothetical protein
MGRAILHLHVAVVLGAMVFVADEDGDRGARGLAFVHPGEDFAGVFFLAGGGDFALAGATTIEFKLDFFSGDTKFGRAAVDDAAAAATVGFAEGGDAEEMAEGAAHSYFVSIEVFCEVSIVPENGTLTTAVSPIHLTGAIWYNGYDPVK